MKTTTLSFHNFSLASVSHPHAAFPKRRARFWGWADAGLRVCCACAVLGAEVSHAQLRYAVPPALASTPLGIEWRAEVDCAPPVSLPSLIGARVGFTYDIDLDGFADATDSLGISPADCGEDSESGHGRILLRRRLATAMQNHAAVLRADLVSSEGGVVASHAHLTHGAGSLLRINRFCASPKNGEPEWIEVRNAATRVLPLSHVRLESRALTGTLAPGESFVAGSDTAELRLWQPGARLIALSSWSNLRNSGDTIRLSFSGGTAIVSSALMLDSLIYGPGASVVEGCASLATEGSAAAASGYALEFSAPRWSRASAAGSATPFTLTVRAPAGGRYDLLVYDLDGRALCALARDAEGPLSLVFPPLSCPPLGAQRAGRVILHLSPRHAPGTRTLLRIAP